MNHPIAPHIKDILTAVDTALKGEGSDKARLRRAKSHLESAYYILGGNDASEAPKASQTASTSLSDATRALCTCPAGTRSKNCPIHSASIY